MPYKADKLKYAKIMPFLAPSVLLVSALNYNLVKMEVKALTIGEKIDIIKYNIEKSAKKAGRNPKDVVILPVSKKKSCDDIREVIALGIDKTGENYVQELLLKYEELKNEIKEFHFIGHLQSNKVKYIIDKVSLIHSVDSVSLLKEINKRSEKIGKIQEVLLEVNFEAEQTKTGATKEELLNMLDCAGDFPNLKLKGLMMMPPAFYTEEQLKKTFYSFRELYEKLKNEYKCENVCFDTLSMGMSNDYALAVEYGSTVVRIGTALFGKREY